MEREWDVESYGVVMHPEEEDWKYGVKQGEGNDENGEEYNINNNTLIGSDPFLSSPLLSSPVVKWTLQLCPSVVLFALL